MKNNRSPKTELSAILITGSDIDILRRSISYLDKQTAKSKIELVIVCPSLGDMNVREGELDSFSAAELVELPDFISVGDAFAAGISRANSPIVAYVEEHSYPDPGWAQAILDAHRGPWAAVGWGIENANPEKMVSWAIMFADFGPWVELASSQEMDRLPGHHCSYKREILAGFGDQLGSLLEIETVLHHKLREAGYRLYCESSTRSAHVNVSKLSSFVEAEFFGSRIYGSRRMRSEKWSTLERLIHMLATPLVPFLLLRRMNQDIVRSGRARQLYPRILPYLILRGWVHSFGELIGYLFGPGQAPTKRMSSELDRKKHL